MLQKFHAALFLLLWLSVLHICAAEETEKTDTIIPRSKMQSHVVIMTPDPEPETRPLTTVETKDDKKTTKVFQWAPPRITVHRYNLYDYHQYCMNSPFVSGLYRPNYKGKRVLCENKLSEKTDVQNNLLSHNKTEKLRTEILPNVTAKYAARTLIRPYNGMFKTPNYSSHAVCKFFSIPQEHRVNGTKDSEIIIYVAAGPMTKDDESISVWAERCPTKENEPIVIVMNFNPKKIMTETDLIDKSLNEIDRVMGTAACKEEKALILTQKKDDNDVKLACTFAQCKDESEKEVQTKNAKDAEWTKCETSSTFTSLNQTLTFQCSSISELCPTITTETIVKDPVVATKEVSGEDTATKKTQVVDEAQNSTEKVELQPTESKEEQQSGQTVATDESQQPEKTENQTVSETGDQPIKTEETQTNGKTEETPIAEPQVQEAVNNKNGTQVDEVEIETKETPTKRTDETLPESKAKSTESQSEITPAVNTSATNHKTVETSTQVNNPQTDLKESTETVSTEKSNSKETEKSDSKETDKSDTNTLEEIKSKMDSNELLNQTGKDSAAVHGVISVCSLIVFTFALLGTAH